MIFKPHSAATLRSVVCTPPRSSGDVARCAPLRPVWRLGKSSSGWRCVCQEAAQYRERCLWQRDEAIPVAFGVAHLDAQAVGVNVADFQSQTFAQTQVEAVEGEVKDAVTEHPRRQKQPLRFIERDNVRQALRLRWLDQVRHRPGLLQYMGGEELRPYRSSLDRAPRVGADQLAEVLGQLRFGEGVDAVIKIAAQAPDGASIGVDGLGL